ncbi:MAG: hypothetical protein WDO74_04810 [Pseudomonadota bacterium]
MTDAPAQQAVDEPKIQQLGDLDQALNSRPERDHRRVRDLFARGKLRTTMRFTREAVKDLEQALEIQEEIRGRRAPPGEETPVYAVLARLAEAIRVDARDRISSMPPGSAELSAATQRSIETFGQAIENYHAEKVDAPANLSWMLAHRAAAYVMRVFVGVTSGNEAQAESDFAAAEANFLEAIRLFQLATGKRYVWADRFRAFSFALRGHEANGETPSDFQIARGILQELDATDSDQLESATKDSEAMLCSYAAFADPVAAVDGIEAALISEGIDPERFRACASRAYCIGGLAVRNPGDALLAANLTAAIDCAKTQAMDALSQAIVTLASLTLLEGVSGGDDPKIASEKANRILSTFAGIGQFPSIEGLSMMLRNPVWKAIKATVGSGDDELRNTEFFARCSAVATKLKPNFDELRQSLAAQL